MRMFCVCEVRFLNVLIFFMGVVSKNMFTLTDRATLILAELLRVIFLFFFFLNNCFELLRVFFFVELF